MVMFFIRLAFWLGVIVMLLPTDAQQQARVYNTAVHAVERASTFCDRNVRTCELGAQTWASFLKKAEFGVRLLGDLITSGGRSSEPDPATPPLRQKASAGGNVDRRGTLSAADLQPAWRGPASEETAGT
jgi:hypothetical protein